MSIKKILCPIDFSEAADQAFEYAVFLAESFEAELALLYVVDQLQEHSYFEILALPPAEIAKKVSRRAHEDLQAVIDRTEKSLVITETVREGKAWVQICEVANEGRADIIVIGSHGRTGLSHVLIGSVAETVVRHASCPVLVVRNSK
jgi:universal stress protein A